MIKKIENKAGTFWLLSNNNMSILLQLSLGKLLALHTGHIIEEDDTQAMCIPASTGWGTDIIYTSGEAKGCLDTIPLAWSQYGLGDLKETALTLASAEGESIAADFNYVSDEITDGIIPMESALPAARPAAADPGESIRFVFDVSAFMPDRRTVPLRLELIFTVFDTAITRRAILRNTSADTVLIRSFLSSLTDLKGEWVMTTFNGQWNSEMHAETVPVGTSALVNSSNTGFSSNRHNPGFVMGRPETTENHGGAVGFNLVYSGSHYSCAARSMQNFTRVVSGINPAGFARPLASGGSFETPEAVMTWSNHGYNGISALMHRFVLDHIVPEYWSRRERPVVYNSWEGSGCDFTEGSLISLAKKALKMGCELFVLDDGWFGARDNDRAGLGDYWVNKKKLPGGLGRLSAKLHAMGLKFGLWFEPESVNPDSDLYRAHPEWALHITGENDLYGRNQLLLDLRREDVREYIVSNVSRIIDAAKLDYVKWDVNRNGNLQGNAAHEYILGLYDVQRRIFGPRPHILLENCASGGNRFDLGMLCFSPQIWASDDTDPIERLDIQNGYSYLYPQSCCSAHISASPHSQTLRNTPLYTDANVAFFGSFGLELELSHLVDVEKKALKAAVDFYKEHRKTLQFGQLLRTRAPEGSVCWQVTSAEETIVGVFQKLTHAGAGYEWLYAKVPSGRYRVASRPQTVRVGQFGALLRYVLPVSLNPNGVVLRTADRHYRMNDGLHEFTCSDRGLAAGIPMNCRYSGTGYDPALRLHGDFGSSVYVITKAE